MPQARCGKTALARYSRIRSVRFVTPSDRHEGDELSLLENRENVYAQARKRRPDRWSGKTRNWSAVDTVTLNPLPVQEVAAVG